MEKQTIFVVILLTGLTSISYVNLISAITTEDASIPRYEYGCTDATIKYCYFGSHPAKTQVSMQGYSDKYRSYFTPIATSPSKILSQKPDINPKQELTVPIVANMSVSTNVATAANITLQGSTTIQNDFLTFKISLQPLHGKLDPSTPNSLGPKMARVFYHPNNNYNGSDEFNFIALSRSGANSSNGVVSITVNPPLHVPKIPLPPETRALIAIALAIGITAGVIVFFNFLIRRPEIIYFKLLNEQGIYGIRLPSSIWDNKRVKVFEINSDNSKGKSLRTGSHVTYDKESSSYFIELVGMTLKNGGQPKFDRVGLEDFERAKWKHIIRDDTWYPSLAIFQFLLWTLVVIFVVLSVYLTRIFGGEFAISPDIPSNLLILMGVTISVPIINGLVSSSKYGTTTPPEVPPTKGVQAKPRKLPPFKTMIMENGKPTLPRFQMFAWTWISIGIYLIFFWSRTLDPSALYNVESLKIPDVNQVFVLLMGLSQGAYITAKASMSDVFSINGIRPHRNVKIGDTVSILGSNFGEKTCTVRLEHYGSRDHANEEEDDNQKYNPGTVDEDVRIERQNIISWTDTRIDIIIPSRLNITKNGKYYDVRVEKDGLETYASSDSELRIIRPLTIIKTIPLGGPVPVNSDVEATFNVEVMPQSVADKFVVMYYDEIRVGANVRYDLRKVDGRIIPIGTRIFRFHPAGALPAGKSFIVKILHTVRDIDGNEMDIDKTWEFVT